MNCQHFTYRSKKGIRNPYCRSNKQWQPICSECQNKSYKSLKELKRSTEPIKQYTKKRAKAERERYSIFTTDLAHCIEDKDHIGEIDLHEIFEGKNRLKSMKYGLVIPVCRNCHGNEEVQKKWQILGRQAFVEKHREELFIKEFQTRKGIKEVKNV